MLLLATRGRRRSSGGVPNYPADPSKFKRRPALCITGSIVERDADIIKREIKSLHRKFHSLIKYFREKFERVEVTDVHDTLLSLPPDLQAIYSPVLDKMFHELEKCESHKEFFSKLNDCWNFIDFDLLEPIVEEHGDNELKSAFETYRKELELFRQSTTVYQLIEIWKPKFRSHLSDIPEKSRDDCKMFVSRLDKDAKAFTVQELDHFRRNAFDFVHPLSVAAVILHNIIISSVTIAWLVAKENVDILSKFISELIHTSPSAFIDSHGIVFLSLDDYILYPVDEVSIASFHYTVC